MREKKYRGRESRKKGGRTGGQVDRKAQRVSKALLSRA